MLRKIILLVCLFVFSSSVMAAKKLKPQSGWSKKLHAPIVVKAVSSDESEHLRMAILQGMLITKGGGWYLDDEGDGYINARFDYRGNVIVVKIEYGNKQVQVKYLEATKAYVCKQLHDGICYRGDTQFFKYTYNLRRSIERQLKSIMLTGG